jgi:hypothetical protein
MENPGKMVQSCGKYSPQRHRGHREEKEERSEIN